MILAKKVAIVVPCLSRISETSMRESTNLLVVLENAEAWVGTRISITRIPVVEESVSMTTISIIKLITRIYQLELG